MSVYNQDLGCIFIHIPRTAGYSMEQLLGKSGHATIKTYLEFFQDLSIGLPNIENIFKFAFVRNPYDRFISGYLKQGLKPGDINDYILAMDWTDNIYFRPQWTFVCLPAQLRPITDFIGRYENLADDWNTVCRTLGIKFKLPLTNQSPHLKCRLNEQARGKLRSVYWDDFERWYPLVED